MFRHYCTDDPTMTMSVSREVIPIRVFHVLMRRAGYHPRGCECFVCREVSALIDSKPPEQSGSS